MPRPLPPRPDLLQLKHQAKDLRKAYREGDNRAYARIREFLPRCASASEAEIGAGEFSLKEAQHVIACEYGFKHWEMLRAVVEVDFDLLANLSDGEAQALIREIDQKDMTVALVSASAAVQENFLSNVSARVASFKRADMEVSQVTAGEIEDARRRILQQTAFCVGQGVIQWPEGQKRQEGERKADPFKAPRDLEEIASRPLDQLNPTDLADLWRMLAAQAQSNGILSLSDYADSIVDRFLYEALQLAIDGCDAEFLRDKMQTRLDYTILQRQRTRGRIAIEGTMDLLAGDHPRIMRHKLSMFVSEPSPDWGEDLAEVTAAELAAQVRQTPMAEIPLEQLVDLYVQVAQLIRVQDTEVLGVLRDTLSQERDTTSELMHRGLDMMLSGIEPSHIYKTMDTQLKTRLDAVEKVHRMVIEGVCALQSGKEPREVEEAVRAVVA